MNEIKLKKILGKISKKDKQKFHNIIKNRDLYSDKQFNLYLKSLDSFLLNRLSLFVKELVKHGNIDMICNRLLKNKPKTIRKIKK